ncbi:hypothetical protein ACEN9Z_14190, partial [Stenotrophomonas geniculata]
MGRVVARRGRRHHDGQSKVAHYPEIMHITPVSSGQRRFLAPALLLALPLLMTACGGGKAT